MRNEEKLPILTVTDAPSAHSEALTEEGLAQFNAENAGYRDARALAVLVSDPDSKAVVITINFQAPEFYQPHGFRIFSQVDCVPGVARIFPEQGPGMRGKLPGRNTPDTGGRPSGTPRPYANRPAPPTTLSS